MRRSVLVLEGTYEASRAAALSGVPISTVYDWASKGVVVPSVSQTKEKLWSYGDLMVLRIVYWLRHRKGEHSEVPASPMPAVRDALHQLDADGLDLWVPEEPLRSALVVDRSGKIVIETAPPRTSGGQGLLDGDVLDLLGPFDHDGTHGPDLRRPSPHLRIVPGRCAGEPHLADTRITTLSLAALARRGFTLDQIEALYPDEDPAAIREAVTFEDELAA